MARPRLGLSTIAAIGLTLCLAGEGSAQEAAGKAKGIEEPRPPATRPVGKSPTNPGGVNRESILRLVTGSNPMIWLLGVCSVVTVGFALERLVALRRRRVIPKDFVVRFHERLAAGKLDRDRAVELCKANDSPVARVFGAIVRHWGQPAATIRQAIESDAAGEILDLRRNVRVLNGTSTLAPLLGLLGTVIGMIESFNALGSKAGGAKSEALAQGISLALVSTAIGLAIAIVSVAMYYLLLNKLDLLVRDLDEQAQKVIDLVSLESIRPTADRRASFSGDPARHESRIH